MSLPDFSESSFGARGSCILCQVRNARAKLCSLGLPESQALLIQPQSYFLTLGERIEEAYALDKTAVPGLASVGHCDVVKRLLLSTTTSQSNRDHK